jgi:hypothetical protein
VERGVWPANHEQARHLERAYPERHEDLKQRTGQLGHYGTPLVAVERIRLIDPTEHRLCLYPPPFLPSRQRTEINWGWEGFFAPEEIDRDKMIEIGDFGHGSDKPIILDYQHEPTAPDVRRLGCKLVRSGPDGRQKSWDNHWVEIAPSFDDFARLLGLA